MNQGTKPAPLAVSSLEPAAGAVPGQVLPVLTFVLAGARFGLTAAGVREVIRAVAIARLPKAPAIVEGVINFRGRIVPVLDIRSRFGVDPSPLRADQHFIVAQAGVRLVALRVDRCSDLLSIDAAAIEAPGHSIAGVEYVAGIARLADGLIVIHDLSVFLSLEEGVALDAVAADAV